MGDLTNVLLGGALILGGIFAAVTGNFALGLRLILAGGLTIATGLTTPSGESAFDTSPRYGFDNLNNQATDGGPIRVIYGKEQIAPDIISQTIDGYGDDATLRILMVIGEGPIEGISDIRLNDTPLEAFDDVQYETRLGTEDQTLVKGFNEVGTPYSSSTRLGSELDGSTVVFDQHVHEMRSEGDAVMLGFTWASGLFAIQKDNDVVAAGWQCRIFYKLATDADSAYKEALPATFGTGIFSDRIKTGEIVQAGGWLYKSGQWHSPEVAARTGHRAQLRVEFPDRARYTIKVVASSDAERANTRVTNAPTLTKVIELRGDQRTYANTALLAITIPPQAQLSGGAPNVKCLVKGRTPYDPRTGETAWSRNPVLCLRDLLTNSRYGLGDDIAESDLDDGIGGSWRTAADACDEVLTGAGLGNGHARHELDLVLDFKGSGGGWVSQITEGARLILNDFDGLIRVRHLEASASVRTFSENEGDGERKNIVTQVVEGVPQGWEPSTLTDTVLPLDQLFNRVDVQYVDRAKENRKQIVTVRDQRISIGTVTGGPFAVGDRISDGVGLWKATITRPVADGDDYLYVSVDDEFDGPVSAGTLPVDGGGSIVGNGAAADLEPERALQIQLFGVTRNKQAIREGRYQLAKAQLTKRFCNFSVFLGDKDLVPGDTIAINSDRLGWSGKLFTILKVTHNMAGRGLLECREYDADVFADNLDRLENVTYFDNPGDSITPNVRPAGSTDSTSSEDNVEGEPVSETQQPASTSASSSGGNSTGSNWPWNSIPNPAGTVSATPTGNNTTGWWN